MKCPNCGSGKKIHKSKYNYPNICFMCGFKWKDLGGGLILNKSEKQDNVKLINIKPLWKIK